MSLSEATVLSSAGDGTTVLWDLQSRVQHTAYTECVAAYRGLAVIPAAGAGASSARPLAAQGWVAAQIGRPALHMWAAAGRDAPLYKCAVADAMLCVASSSDGSFVASGGASGKAFLWDATTGELLRVWSAHYKGVSALAFLPGAGGGLASGGQDGIIHVWDVASLVDVAAGGDVSSSPPPYVSWTEHSLGVTSLRCGVGFNAGAVLISGSLDRTARLWHVPSKRCLLSVSLPAAVNVADVDAGGQRLYAGCADGVVYATAIAAAAAADAAPEAKLHRATLVASAWGGGSGGSNSSSTSGTARPDAFVGHTAAVTDLALTPDGATLVTGGDDCSVRVWDARSGRQLHCAGSWHKGPIAGLLLLPKLAPRTPHSHFHGDARSASSLAPLKKHHIPLPAEWRGSTTGPTGKEMVVLPAPHLPDEATVEGINDAFREGVVALQLALAVTSEPAVPQTDASAGGTVSPPAAEGGEAAAAAAAAITQLQERITQLESEALRWSSVNNALLARLQVAQQGAGSVPAAGVGGGDAVAAAAAATTAPGKRKAGAR